MHELLTDEDNIITSCSDLNIHHGEEKTLLCIVDDYYSEFTIVGCNTLYDIAYYTSANKLITKAQRICPEEWMLMKIRILDPENLPYDIEYGDKVYVFFDLGFFFEADTMQKAVDHIEGIFQMGWANDIDEFAVVTGIKLRDEMNYRLAGSMNTFDGLLAERSPEVNENLSSCR